MSGSHITSNKNIKQSKIIDTDSKGLPTIDAENAMAGGVWAQTSAKRDKIGELRMELKFEKGERSLDDKASEGELLDLYLVDGMQAVFMALDDDKLMEGARIGSGGGISPVLQDFEILLQQGGDSFRDNNNSDTTTAHMSSSSDIQINKEQFEAHISGLRDQLSILKNQYYPSHKEKDTDTTDKDTDTATTTPPYSSPLSHLRDIYIYPPPSSTPNAIPKPANSDDDSPKIPSKHLSNLTSPITQPLHQCADYFTILLLESTLYYVAEQWDDFTTVSDSDIDRAATKANTSTGTVANEGGGGDSGVDRPTTIAVGKLHGVLRASYNSGMRNDFDTAGSDGGDAITVDADSNADDATTTSATSPPASLPLAAPASATKRTTEAYWNLIDRDNDGMIDQAEMDKVVQWSLQPVKRAFQLFVEEALDVAPLRQQQTIATIEEEEEKVAMNTNDTADADASSTTKSSSSGGGWYSKRKTRKLEQKSKKILLKLLKRTVQKHFEIDVETPHRLRCIYAWADKKHQNGMVDSVLVEEHNPNQQGGGGDDGDGSSKSGGGFMGLLGTGRTRYVELDPKISYDEFKIIQEEHFPHLDKASRELCTSLKEDIWVHQGKGRQNLELKREITGFLILVGLIDVAITLG